MQRIMPDMYWWRLEICIKWCIAEFDGKAVLKNNQIYLYYYMATVGNMLL